MSKLIFLDIDGTLTEAGTNVPPESAVKAMESARAAGHKLFLCTGRNYGMLKPLLRYPFDGMVASSGGYVTAGDTILKNEPMEQDTLQKALEILHKNGVICTIEGKEGSFGDSDLKELLSGTQGGNSELERWRKAISENLGIKPIEEYDGQPIYKIVVMAKKASQLDECRKLLEPQFHFVVQDMPDFGIINGEILSSALDKGVGVRLIAEHFGMPIEDTIGFGDSMNDLEMVETVGYSVCMENGSETLKKCSDMVCPSVTEDGLYQAFEKLGLL
ncbi:MAG: HAD family hydrolase [Eubacteriales bacterium]|nr:HAD family hydrolase [Eubacteriales bacterium]